jgi:ribose-phosphate pyrophosphokinase
MISALRNASSRHVTAVVPYFGFMRSDGSELPSRRVGKNKQAPYDDEIAIEMIDTHRTSFVAMADVAKMFEIVGCTRVVTFDLHASGQSVAEGFFADTRVENLRSAPMVAAELAKKLSLDPSKELVVLAPHSSCFSKAKKFQAHLRAALNSENVGLALVVRRPPSTESGETVVDLVGDVKGKNILIVEDIVDSGRSLARAARAAREAGANHVYAFASHAVLSGDAPIRLQKCEALEKVIVLNTVPVSQENRTICPKLEFIDVSPFIAKLLMELHMKEETM